MKFKGITYRIPAFAFSLIVLFTVSVQETHYLFSEHHSIAEHCENHLHQDEEHAHCSVCKFDVSLFTDEIAAHTACQPVFFSYQPAFLYQRNIPATDYSHHFLRGPPQTSSPV